MNTQTLLDLLEKIKQHTLSPQEAVTQINGMLSSYLGFAEVDVHRGLRTGFPEVIFCQNKTGEQILGIAQEISKHAAQILLTRANSTTAEILRSRFSSVRFYEQSGVIVIGPPVKGTGRVTVVSAGTSDIPVAEEAAVTAGAAGANVQTYWDIGVAGIHRLFSKIDALRQSRVIVAVAGMDGALASVIAGLVSCPVIAVPTSVGYGAHLNGIAPLLTMLNSCAPGVTVVNIDNGFGAGYTAALINRLGE